MCRPDSERYVLPIGFDCFGMMIVCLVDVYIGCLPSLTDGRARIDCERIGVHIVSAFSFAFWQARYAFYRAQSPRGT